MLPNSEENSLTASGNDFSPIRFSHFFYYIYCFKYRMFRKQDICNVFHDNKDKLAIEEKHFAKKDKESE